MFHAMIPSFFPVSSTTGLDQAITGGVPTSHGATPSYHPYMKINGFSMDINQMVYK